MNPKVIVLPLKNRSRVDAKAVAEKLLNYMKHLEEKQFISSSERRHIASILTATRGIGIKD